MTQVPVHVRVPFLLAFGMLLAQSGWLLSVPAFRGPDEFDHAYRAAAVARGEWAPSGRQAENGRGELLTVPQALVEAASPECRAAGYTGRDNCTPVARHTDGSVEVAGAAARYHPAYYWLVGKAAGSDDGTTMLYKMRIVSMLLSVALVSLSGWAVSLWARTRWPLAALLACLSPVVVYSSIVVAPNAVEILAALSLWLSLLGLTRRDLSMSVERALLWASVPAAVVLATVRTLGIGWLALCVLASAAVLSRGLPAVVRRNRSTVVICSSVVLLAVAAGGTWLRFAAPNRPEEHLDNPDAVAGSLIQLPVWVLQTISAAPGRTDPAPVLVYLLCGAVIGSLVVTGLRFGDRRLRLVLTCVGVLSLAGPLVVTLLTYRDVGVVWQGRYGMPLSLGVILLAGLALDRPACRVTTRPGWLFLGGLLWAIGHTIVVVDVLDSLRRVSPSVAGGLWHVPSPWLVGALMLASWAVMGLALWSPFSRTVKQDPSSRLLGRFVGRIRAGSSA